MSSYKELIVWKKAFNLTILIYSVTKTFPREELFALTTQIRRAAVAIISNIAEGNSRKYRKEYIQFLSIAYGSAAELETQLLLAKHLQYLNEANFEKINNLLTEVMKMLNKMITSLKINA